MASKFVQCLETIDIVRHDREIRQKFLKPYDTKPFLSNFYATYFFADQRHYGSGSKL